MEMDYFKANPLDSSLMLARSSTLVFTHFTAVTSSSTAFIIASLMKAEIVYKINCKASKFMVMGYYLDFVDDLSQAHQNQ